MTLSPLKNWILDLLFPPYCVGCKSEGELLCSVCRAALAVVPPACFICKKWVPETLRVNPGRTCKSCQGLTHIYAFLSPFSFDQETVRELVHALKYQRVRSIGGILGGMLADYCRKFKVDFPKETAVVPLPLAGSRKRRRGFNQAELIARAFAAQIAPGTLLTDVLKKIKNTKAQVELSGEKRRQNVIGAFAVVKPELILDKTIVLLDDVKTTGATLEEAARTLKMAGAKRVWAITVAH